MQGNPEVIAGLNRVYSLLLATEQQAHMQEHYYEEQRWAFSSWFDEIEENGHQKLIHPLMKRLNALGAGRDLDYRYGFEPVVRDDLAEAMTLMLDALRKVHAAYGEACERAEADDDYVTEELIWRSLKWLEKRMRKFEARLAKCQKIGMQRFLAEYL